MAGDDSTKSIDHAYEALEKRISDTTTDFFSGIEEITPVDVTMWRGEVASMVVDFVRDYRLDPKIDEYTEKANGLVGGECRKVNVMKRKSDNINYCHSRDIRGPCMTPLGTNYRSLGGLGHRALVGNQIYEA